MVALFALVVSAQVASASILYTVQDLGTLGGTESRAYGISPNGKVVGWTKMSDNAQHAFLYSNGSMQDLGTLGGRTSTAYGVNNLGQVVGESDDTPNQPPNQGSQHAFLYSEGLMQNLGTLGGDNSIANGINNNGQVVGRAKLPNHVALPFVWENGLMQGLGTNPGEATGINSRGEVVGSSNGNIFLYSGGIMQNLGTLAGFPGGNALGLNNNKDVQVVGYSWINNGQTNHAFLWQSGSMQDLGTLGGQSSIANGINDNGQVVGSANTLTGSEQAFLYSNGQIQNLNNLIDPTSGWTLTVATAINDSGQIVGYGTNNFGQRHGFLLTPVPEPATLALLLTFYPLLFRRRVER